MYHVIASVIPTPHLFLSTRKQPKTPQRTIYPQDHAFYFINHLIHKQLTGAAISVTRQQSTPTKPVFIRFVTIWRENVLLNRVYLLNCDDIQEIGICAERK